MSRKRIENVIYILLKIKEKKKEEKILLDKKEPLKIEPSLDFDDPEIKIEESFEKLLEDFTK